MEMRIGSVFNSILCAYGCEFCRLSLDVVLNQYSSNYIIVIRTKPFFYWGTPDLRGSQSEWVPLRTTRWNLLDRKELKSLRRLPSIPLQWSLYISPSCQTLSKALEISKNTALSLRLVFKGNIYIMGDRQELVNSRVTGTETRLIIR